MKRKTGTLLLAAAAGAMMTMAAGAFAQAPAGGPPGGGPPRGMGMGMGMMTPDRATTIQRNGLADPALNLTAAQKAEIDKAADAYAAEIKTINEKYPMPQGSPPSQESMQEAMGARTKARENLTAAVNKVLNAEQKKTWEAAQAARRQGGPGGMGMGGGPGGPPGGARPPGQ